MNSKAFSLGSTIVVALMLIIGAVFCYGAMVTELDPVTKQAVGDTSSVDRSVSFSMFLFYASLALVVAFTVWGIIINPKRFIPSMIGTSVMLVIFLISYGMASGEATGALTKMAAATEFVIKWTDLGVIMTYILFILAVVLLIAQSIRSVVQYFAK
ncbi:MAG: hypothetical protein JNJ99_05895 [Crocinitomicaceae bacterium]|nr:hypothetical protein [Crocinitomicaceae bacterium]